MFYGLIYQVTHKETGKSYIGQTTQTLNERWFAHCSGNSHCVALSAAIGKYGKEAFAIKAICFASNQDDLNDLERLHIESLDTVSPAGYNIKHGGGSKGKWSSEFKVRHAQRFACDELRQLCRDNTRRMWNAEGKRETLSAAIKAGLGREDVRIARSEKAKAVALDPEVKSRISAGQRRRFSNLSEREKCSERSKRRYADPAYAEAAKERSKEVAARPEFRARVSASLKAKWADPQYRARQVESMSAGKARKRLQRD